MFAWNVVYISKVVQLQFIQALRRFSTQNSNEARSLACSLRVCHAHNICMFGIFTKWLYGWLSISLCHSWKSVEKESVWKPLWIRNVPMQSNAMCTFPYLCNTFKLFLLKSDCALFRVKTKQKNTNHVCPFCVFLRKHILSSIDFNFSLFDFFHIFFRIITKEISVYKLWAYFRWFLNFYASCME